MKNIPCFIIGLFMLFFNVAVAQKKNAVGFQFDVNNYASIFYERKIAAVTPNSVLFLRASLGAGTIENVLETKVIPGTPRTFINTGEVLTSVFFSLLLGEGTPDVTLERTEKLTIYRYTVGCIYAIGSGAHFFDLGLNFGVDQIKRIETDYIRNKEQSNNAVKFLFNPNFTYRTQFESIFTRLGVGFTPTYGLNAGVNPHAVLGLGLNF